ncbi:manganese catalase family protein [Priestia megaterium]|nr:manganese catalase family protein [Priestia megaterium]MDF2053257.1 manganese catalase family protein [Priestia megaterium]MDF2062649.1 manganese catalase family protein [Priestia megaterium]
MKELQYRAKPNCSDPLFVKQLQEALDERFVETSVAL